MTTIGLTGRALGEAVIDHVLTFPEEHDQGIDHCGSTGCMVGWTIWLALDLPAHLRKDVGWDFLRQYDAELERRNESATGLAAELLGVDRTELFSAVYVQQDRDMAIANFKHLLDVTYSEPTP